MRKKKSLTLWLVALLVIGAAFGLVVQQQIRVWNQLVTVYVASHDIPVDHVMTIEDLKKEQRPAPTVPADAIKDPNEVVGKYTAVGILPNQILQQRAMTDAKTMREVIRRFGMDFRGLALPVDQNDMPIEMFHAGDIVDILGVFSDKQMITSRYISEGVPVTAVINNSSEKKLMMAVPRADVPEIAKDAAAGKIRFVLNPRPFQKVVTPMPENPSVSDQSNVVEPENSTDEKDKSNSPQTAN